MALKRGIPLPATMIKDAATRQVVQALYEEILSLRADLATTDAKAEYRVSVKARNPLGHHGMFQTFGINGQIDVIRTSDGVTLTLNISDGQISNYSGQFDVFDPATGSTITLSSDGGIIIPSTSFLGINPATGDTKLVTVYDGRVIML